MEKLTKIESLELAKKVANHFFDLGYNERELLEMDKHELSVKMDNPAISNMPDRVSMYDGHDIEEEDTFDYFQTLVKFEYVIRRRKSEITS
jgi:hypothetical protein